MKFIAAVLLAVTASAADPQLGKKIYVRGEGSSAIEAEAGTMTLPATVMRCANCHGYEGRGNAEGGVKPSNLQWSELTKPYGDRPPYTAATLKRAIAMGIDSAGNELDRVMPRYRMTARDADDLVAYLQTLGRVSDPGLSDDSIRVGVLLSPDRTRASAVREIVTGFFDAINTAGGLYGRRVDLRFAELPVDTSERRDAVQRFLDAEQPFALAASSLLGAEEPLAQLIEEREIPSLAAFSNDAPEQRYLFRLLGSTSQEIAALRAFADGDVVDDTTPPDQMKSAKAILITDRARIADIVRFAATLPAPPRILVPSSLADGSLFAAPPALDRRILVALPSAPTHLTPEGLRELRALSPRAAAHPQTAAAALTSAKLLAEALRRAGRDLSREKLVEALEGFYNVPTGLTPPITFGPLTRVGTRAAWVAEVDLQAKALTNGRWMGAR